MKRAAVIALGLGVAFVAYVLARTLLEDAEQIHAGWVDDAHQP